MYVKERWPIYWVSVFLQKGHAMLVYITRSAKTELAPAVIRGLPLWHLAAGRGFFARRRAGVYLRRLYASGVRRGVFEDENMAVLAARCGIAPVPVLPLRLALLDQLLDALCIDGLPAAAVYLRCGRGGETAARQVAAVLARRARYIRLDEGDPAGLTDLLLHRWGISPGDGGLTPALTVCTGHDAPTIDGPALYLTDDCARVQSVTYASPSLPEPLLAALTAADKCQPSEIHVASVISFLDRRRENNYNAT